MMSIRAAWPPYNRDPPTIAGHKELYAHSTTRLTCLPVLDQSDGELSFSKKRFIRSQTSLMSWLEIEITFRGSARSCAGVVTVADSPVVHRFKAKELD